MDLLRTLVQIPISILTTLIILFRVVFAKSELPPKNLYLGEDATLTLSDFRILGYNLSGTEGGFPVFILHGFPGSRVEATIWHEPALALGCRIIGIDRPGIGLSSPQQGRRILDHAKDVAELARHLGLESYAVIGVSGGGPYALACASSHSPTQLRAVVLVAGQGPAGVGLEGERFGNRLLFWLVEHFPWLTQMIARRAAKRMVDPKTTTESLMRLEKIQLSSQAIFDRGAAMDYKAVSAHEDLFRILNVSGKQFWRQGGEAFTEEGRLLVMDQSVSMQSVRVLTRLWYGKFDINVPTSMGGRIAKQLPAGVVTRMEELDETHISLVLNRRTQVLEDLLQVVKETDGSMPSVYDSYRKPAEE